MPAPQLLLIVAGMAPWVGAIGFLSASAASRPALARIAAYLGMALGFLSSISLLAWFAASESDHSTQLSVTLYRLFTFREPQGRSLTLGLAADLPTVIRVAVTGALFLLTEWYFHRNKRADIASNIQLAHALLYTAIVTYLFAPNLPQSVLSLSATVLFGAALWHLHSTALISDSLAANLQPHVAGTSEIALRRSGTIASRPLDASRLEPASRHRFAVGLQRLTQWTETITHGLTLDLPIWLGEQVELVADSSVTVRQLAIVGGTMAVLLTWLLAT